MPSNESTCYEFSRAIVSALASEWRQSPNADGIAETLGRLDEHDLTASAFRMPEPLTKPVVRCFPDVLTEVETAWPDLAGALRGLAPHLRWLQSASYTDEILGDGFKQNYAWCEIIGTEGFFPGKDFILGFLLLGPNRHYLDHYHPAPELYWPMTAGSHWKKGHGDFVERKQGEIIWHPSMTIHATITKAKPLLAAYAWTRDTSTGARLCALDA